MNTKQKRQLTDRSLKLVSLLIGVALLCVAPHSFAADDLLDGRQDMVSDSSPSAVATHEFAFTTSNTGVPVGSISLEFCSNNPIIGDACVAPSGLDVSGVTIGSQQGELGFSVSGLTTANRIILTRAALLPTGVASRYRLDNIINPNATGSYYVRIQTYTSTDATGTDIESGGVVFAIVTNLTLSTEVPPYLTFCTSVTITGLDCSSANSYLIDLGEFSPSKTTSASSELVVASNAANGFSVTMSGTTLTSGNNTIPALSGAGSAQGTSQFGINLRSNSSPAIGADPTGPGVLAQVTAPYDIPNSYRFQNGDIILSSIGSSDLKKFTMSYVVNVGPSQPAGYYAATMTYICLANF